MGSMAMSVFMMFVPRHVEFIFLTILCVGFFGVYVPWNERKKRGKTQNRKPYQPQKTKRDPASVSSRLEQLKTLRDAGLIDDREYQQKRRKLWVPL